MRWVRSQQPLRVVSELPDNLSPVTAEQPAPTTGFPTSADNGFLMPPDLPGITLSAIPLSHSSLSAVYLGWDTTHRCDVVVKVQRVTTDPVAMDRFRREAAVMAQLRHPSIVSLHRFYEGNPAALVMEYVSGQTLAARVTADGWLSSVQVAAIVESVAAGLDCAHASNIIHRDVKPANILLPKRGPARLTDFGVAHIDTNESLTLMGDMLGTIEYASPEQVRGHEAPDARSDVYSLAAAAYFALTGTPPFRAADESTQAQLSVMHRQVFADPPPLRFHRENISPAVESVVLRGLAKAPEDRFQSAGHFAAALQAAAKTEGGTPEQNALAAASRRTGVLAGFMLAAALLMVGGGIWWKTSHASSPATAPVLVVVRPQLPPVQPQPLEVPPSAPIVPKSKPQIVAVKPRRVKPPVQKRLAVNPVVKARIAAPPIKVKRLRKLRRVPITVPAPKIAGRLPVRVPRKPAARIRPVLIRKNAVRKNAVRKKPTRAPVLAAIPAKEAAEPAAPHLRNP